MVSATTGKCVVTATDADLCYTLLTDFLLDKVRSLNFYYLSVNFFVDFAVLIMHVCDSAKITCAHIRKKVKKKHFFKEN